jgi:uncharacterized membrane protein YdjX (TVP38/TMEM64 family)
MVAQSGRREYLSLAAVAAVLVCAVWLARSHAESLKQFIDHHAIQGVVVYIILNILDAVIAPGATLPLIPIAAHAWGRVPAAIVTTVGWTAGSLVAFYIARRWGSPIVKKLTSMERLKRLQPYVPKHPFWSVVLLRLIVPMDVISYVLGLFTEMTWPSYALATALGLTPSAFILAYIGRMPRAYDIIMFGIGGAVLGWIVYSTRRGARKPVIATFGIKHDGRSRSHARHSHRRSSRFTAMVIGTMFWSGALFAEPVAVRYTEGIVHGFLTLRTVDGTLIANGDLIQLARGDRVTSRLVFRFKDGSIRDETAVYIQRGTFRLLRNHLVQKGPSFPQPLDVSIECASGDVTVRYTDDHGKETVEAEKMDLPPDLANGMTLTLLKNMRPSAPPAALSMVAATPKPRLVKLAISNSGEESFSTGGTHRRATHYIVKVEIGGVARLIAPLVGKQPPDSHVWILQGDAPAFVKSEGPLFLGGPVWRIELVSPVWPKHAPAAK